ncbi:hypothetical protein BGZ92_004741 [Podila epicladia]|nr:hypothetical protein BGZ92_004741 [Podila epicladia]
MFGRAWVLETQGQWDPKQQSTGFQLSTPPDERAYIYSVLAHYKRSDIENTDIRSVTTGVQRCPFKLESSSSAWVELVTS